ncbi:MAG: hypothetical protein F6J86_14765 [Symploca sp. SIO1B1]|nr:hypothetical protein [Symploca sp. SIO1B1]
MGHQTDIEMRLAYERYKGRRVSDSHWSNVKKTLREGGFDVTDETVVFYAKLRELLPRSTASMVDIFEAYQKAQNYLALNSNAIKGSEVLEVLNAQGINPHKGTISRWFKKLGGFRKNRLYYPEKLTPIFTSAFLYKVSKVSRIGA